MTSKLKANKRPQRTGLFELEYTQDEDKKPLPKKRSSIRKYYPMKVSHNSMEEEDYIEIASQIVGLEPTLILTSEGLEDWSDEDDDL